MLGLHFWPLTSLSQRDGSSRAALDLSNQLPQQELLRYSTSRNEGGRQHGELRYNQTSLKESDEARKDDRGPPPSVHSYVWGPPLQPKCSAAHHSLHSVPASN